MDTWPVIDRRDDRRAASLVTRLALGPELCLELELHAVALDPALKPCQKTQPIREVRHRLDSGRSRRRELSGPEPVLDRL